mmetsp:Transcript_8855/g.26889  ORF Transcript_8855/g.26889 Transcript_8855/m.26889 type:complete len:211 (-) Transcript_8855:478-1110(-)
MCRLTRRAAAAPPQPRQPAARRPKPRRRAPIPTCWETGRSCTRPPWAATVATQRGCGRRARNAAPICLRGCCRSPTVCQASACRPSGRGCRRLPHALTRSPWKTARCSALGRLAHGTWRSRAHGETTAAACARSRRSVRSPYALSHSSVSTSACCRRSRSQCRSQCRRRERGVRPIWTGMSASLAALAAPSFSSGVQMRPRHGLPCHKPA